MSKLTYRAIVEGLCIREGWTVSRSLSIDNWGTRVEIIIKKDSKIITDTTFDTESRAEVAQEQAYRALLEDFFMEGAKQSLRKNNDKRTG